MNRMLAAMAMLVCALWLGGPAHASRTMQGNVIVVRDDRGGKVSSRAAEISQMKARGQRVEIRGRICLSSCTMYLALPGACVEATTSFGFHGPSNRGARLSENDFEYWSQVIAAHYPEPLRAWYMETGRTQISEYFQISGAELIRLGLRGC
ncbi:MAG: hypothetical protein ACJA06_000120 [Halocynthiibacter sp.]|jgi:hypothetical protein